MNTLEDTRVTAPSQPEINLTTPSDRRADIESKQAWVSKLMAEIGCDGLLVLQPENFAWLTAGGISRGCADPDAMPALYFTAEGRWLLSSNVDSQRLFDEEIDALGFQLKEWPWHWGREQLLADLCQGRNVACDMPLGACQVLGDRLHRQRRSFTEYEQACLRALGQIVSHALEATGRTLTAGETEREVAGQLSHRLMHRGAMPLVVTVAADGRSRVYRQGGFTAASIRQYAVLSVVARKYGLCVRASRAISIGQPEAQFRKEYDAVCKVSATYIASSWPDAVPRQILASAQRIYQIAGAEHEWALSPQGHLIGRAISETALTPRNEELLPNHSAVAWTTSVGAALSCDTFLISEDGPKPITAAENWPLKRIKIQGADFYRPDILVR
ncbi:MAG: M24 family metallopeptidase [Planctomycetes bacterium]|nr:M24 family metallopeptidase [Planctomycetota bacterium]